MSDDKPITSANEGDDSVRILPPDFSIKEKIGRDVDLSTIFTPERIAAAQKAIDDTQSEFVGWANKDLVELDHAFRALEKTPDDRVRIDKILKIAFSLKCQCGTFGFQLGSEVADSLYIYINEHPKLQAEQLTVIRKHIDSIGVILHQNIQGDGNKIGTELMANLHKLVKKLG